MTKSETVELERMLRHLLWEHYHPSVFCAASVQHSHDDRFLRAQITACVGEMLDRLEAALDWTGGADPEDLGLVSPSAPEDTR